MRKLSHLIDWMSRLLAYLAAACSLGIMVVLLVDLGHRNLRGASLVGSYEVVIMLMLCVVFLGLPYAERSGTSVRVTLITDRLRPQAAALTRLASILFAAGVAAWLAFASWTGFSKAFASNDYMAGLIKFPTWPMRLAIAVGVTMLAVVLVAKVAEKAAASVKAFRGAGESTMTDNPAGNGHRKEAETTS